MRKLRAVWRIVACLAHVLRGVLICAFIFPFLSPARRVARVGPWCATMLRVLGIRVVVHGEVHAAPVMVVANHVSWIDILAINAAHTARFVSKADIRRWPVIGWLTACGGTLFIERERKRDAMRVVHQIADALKGGDVVAVFPEGTTSDGHGVLPFHANLLQAAITTRSPVQPMALRYADAASPISASAAYIGDTNLMQSLWWVVNAEGLTATVQVLPAHYSAHAQRRALSDAIRQSIASSLEGKVSAAPSRVLDHFVHQIWYDEASRARLDPALVPLDNSAPERPDWFEFWAILQFLRTHELHDDRWYGFLSPKFGEKFGMTGGQLIEMLNDIGDSEDVVLMSPHWDQAAYFLNAFEQGEFWVPGIMDVGQGFVDRIGLGLDLRQWVADSKSTVFSNYLVAKPVFWREWLWMAEQFLACCEGRDDALAASLNASTGYASGGIGAPMRVFIQERLACLLLAAGRYRVGVVDLSDWATIDQVFMRDEAMRAPLQRCDGLKRQYIETRDPETLRQYRALRASIPLREAYPAGGA